MTTVDEHIAHAPIEHCFRVAANVEDWPNILPHYRWVHFHARNGPSRGRVEMAAWRNFAGPIRYPTWWASEMRIRDDEPAIYYRHVAGITRGMDVKWEFLPEGAHTLLRVTHSWNGPRWPLIGRHAWKLVIAPYFVSAIAKLTLAGVAREAERLATGNIPKAIAEARPTPESNGP